MTRAIVLLVRRLETSYFHTELTGSTVLCNHVPAARGLSARLWERRTPAVSVMAVVVSLKDVVDAMDVPNSEWISYLNPKTGEIVTVTDEDRHLVEDQDLDEADLPDWQRESLPKVREALESGDFVALPDKWETHEWAMMERFSSSQASEARREELLDAIQGRGAFRSFRSAIRRLGIEDDWFRFRQLAFEEIAKDWLRAHDISFR